MKLSDWKRVSNFLELIGIEARIGPVPSDNFIPGVGIVKGALVVDLDECLVGDILHEAGHVAVVPSLFREGLSGDLDDCSALAQMEAYLRENPMALARSPEDPVARGILQAGENEATAWSYAAAVHLGYEGDVLIERPNAFVEVVTTPAGDEMVNRAEEIGGLVLMQLEARQHLGINGLRAAGFIESTRSFPRMKRWAQV